MKQQLHQDFCNRLSSVSWSTLSNAADRSSNVNIARSPESKAIEMSDSRAYSEHGGLRRMKSSLR